MWLVQLDRLLGRKHGTGKPIFKTDLSDQLDKKIRSNALALRLTGVPASHHVQENIFGTAAMTVPVSQGKELSLRKDNG